MKDSEFVEQIKAVYDRWNSDEIQDKDFHDKIAWIIYAHNFNK